MPTKDDENAETPETGEKLPAEKKPAASESEKLFTQEQVNRFLAQDRRQEAAKFADYEQLKAAAAKWAEIEEAQKTEAEKTRELVQKLQLERDVALATANERLTRAAFMTAAARAGVLYPEDVYALADRSKVAVDAQGAVTGVEEAVEVVVKAGRVPLAAKAAPAKLDGGAGSGARSAEKTLAATDEEVAMAAKLGVPLEKYLARRKEQAKAK